MHTADGSWLAALCLASMTVAAAWCMALGIIGLANRAGKRLAGHPQLRERIRYVAEASFWIYLMHHPLVGLIQIDLKWLLPTLSPFAKACLATSIALVWSLASYEWLLRTSKLGRLIGITSAKREPASGLSADSAASRPAVRAAA